MVRDNIASLHWLCIKAAGTWSFGSKPSGVIPGACIAVLEIDAVIGFIAVRRRCFPINAHSVESNALAGVETLCKNSSIDADTVFK